MSNWLRLARLLRLPLLQMKAFRLRPMIRSRLMGLSQKTPWSPREIPMAPYWMMCRRLLQLMARMAALLLFPRLPRSLLLCLRNLGFPICRRQTSMRASMRFLTSAQIGCLMFRAVHAIAGPMFSSMVKMARQRSVGELKKIMGIICSLMSRVAGCSMCPAQSVQMVQMFSNMS